MFLLRLLFKKERFIISRRNSGFGDNLITAANAWRYAKKTNRTLVIVWAPSRYVADKRENAFSHFFSVPESIGGVPVIVEERIDRVSAFLIAYSIVLLPFPDPLIFLYGLLLKLGLNVREQLRNRRDKRQVSTDRIINNSEESVWKIFITNGGYFYNDDNMKTFFDALRLRPELLKEADEFAGRFFRNKKVIGVHIRYYGRSLPRSFHTDVWLDETDALVSCYNKIKEAAAGMEESEYVVFLCTDSRMVHDFLTQSIGNLITYQKEFGSDGSKELHQELPVETAAASLIEMFLLAKSDILVRFPAWSWFSHYASLYANKIIT
ncbi:MAG TPA: nodulation protein NodZ [Thermodesulfobacteriota bacterium]|nr:nodulation protein NodZ [Thermodesulfobacteriota bacterium]